MFDRLYPSHRLPREHRIDFRAEPVELSRAQRAARALAASALTFASLVVLYLLARPWRDLGGLVDERLRWLEDLVLYCGAIVGFTAARAIASQSRDVEPAVRRPCVVLLYPAGLATTAFIVGLEMSDFGEAVLIATTALASYASGVLFALYTLPWFEQALAWQAGSAGHRKRSLASNQPRGGVHAPLVMRGRPETSPLKK